MKNARAEADLPQFDLGQKVGRKIGLQRSRRAVVLCVVDAADFDGSLPRTALQALFSNIEGYQVFVCRSKLPCRLLQTVFPVACCRRSSAETTTYGMPCLSRRFGFM